MSIAVFDSGVGGISVLKSLVEVMPNEDFIYYGDSANAPYGTKTLEQVRALTCEHAGADFKAACKGARCRVQYSDQCGSTYIKGAVSRCAYRGDRACSQACDAFYEKSESACDGDTYDYQGGKAQKAHGQIQTSGRDYSIALSGAYELR